MKTNIRVVRRRQPVWLVGLLVPALVTPASAGVLFSTGAEWKFRPGTNEASSPVTAWRQLGFDDSPWTPAPAPFWYGDVRPGGTELGGMQNVFTCIFLRKTLVLTNAAEIGGLRLNYFIDDGFVAWINGVEVFRENVDVAIPTPTISTTATNQPTDPAPFTSAVITPVPGVLQDGTNVIAVQVFNTSLGSSDLGFDASLESLIAETNPPVIASVNPPPGTVGQLTQITVTFSEPVTGVDAADFRINGYEPGGFSGSGDTYTFTFPQPLIGLVLITWNPAHGITDLALTPNAFDAVAYGNTWGYELVDNTPPFVAGQSPLAGLTVRTLTQIEVRFSEPVIGVDAADLQINGSPAANLAALEPARYLFTFPSPPTGMVEVTWSAPHGIQDLAAVPNAFAGAGWNYVLDPNAPQPDLVLNELVASNQEGLRDEDGEPQDWIEIYNRGPVAVNLEGWALSDDPTLGDSWIFPACVLGSGEYLVVFASGKNRRSPAGTNRFHLDFQLSGAGEPLGLYTPDLPPQLASGFAPYPEQRNDVSYGCGTNGSLRYFAVPTPGAPNGDSLIRGVCAPVHFSMTRGFYSNAFNLYLTTTTPDAAIRYTTDGSEPTASRGALYTGPLRLTNSTFLRAAAFKTNHLSSLAGTHSYLFNVSAALRSLPVISLVTASNNLYGPSGIIGINGGSFGPSNNDVWRATNNVPDTNEYHNPSKHGLAWERPTSVEWINPLDNSGFQTDCGIRVQGSDYQRPRIQPNFKLSFRLYFRGDYGPGRLDYPLFPLTPIHNFDQLVLRAGFNEKNNPFIRDELVRRLSHDMGQVSPHGNLAVLCINGRFMTSTADAGNSPWYNPCERVHEEFMQSYFGGSDEWDVVGPSFATGAGAPGVIDGDRTDFQNLVSYVRTQPTTNAAVYQTIARRLDLTNFVDYCLLNAYTVMGDWPQNNWRAGKDRSRADGPWRFVVWDAEWGMGIYSRTVDTNMFTANGPGPDAGGLSSTSDSEIAQMYQRLILNREFRLLWADRIHKHFFNGGALTGASISNRTSELRAQLQSFFSITDSKLLGWPRDRLPIIMAQFNTHGLYGYSNATHGVYASSNAPAFNQHGGRVPPGFILTMTAPLGGTIYYTTDGTDPRVPFTGAVATNALAYTGPVPLSQSVILRARTLLDATHWSAVNEANFSVASLGLPLRITEIMYNPAGGNNAYEYIELQNFGASAIDLSGMSFEGVDLRFTEGTLLAAGTLMVVCSDADPLAFITRYPSVPLRATFGGQLSNGGERLALTNRFGQIVVSVDYDDANGWPTAADGGGYSLEIMDPFGDPDSPANWRASLQPGGSPSVTNAVVGLGDVRLSEVMADNVAAVTNGNTVPDWVELVNAGSTTVNLAGWSLTDDGNPRKFVFPATDLAPGAFLVVWCDNVTNTTPGLHTGFALGRKGETLSLYDAATNRMDALSFGLQIPDFSVGRIEGEWTLTLPTPNATNVAAALGSATNLALNEWMANPPPGQDDWLELFNASTNWPVSLHGLYVGTSNAVQQITSLSFIAPGGFAQLFADEQVGADHLDFKLPAAGGALVLYDAVATEIQRVTYAAQTEGVSRGRLPDGSATFTNFVGSASPEASNYLLSYPGPYLNEVMARNRTAVTNGAGQVADWLELFNPNGTNVDLGGMSLSIDEVDPGQWVFPASTIIPPFGFLVIWCDGSQAASTNFETHLNLGRSLDGESGGAYLFNAAGQLLNSVEYGFQVDDQSVGRVGTLWRLLSAPTPGATNAAAATLGAATSLRFNEWMANPEGGDDWFEIYNLTNRPVDLGGLYLTDDATSAGLTQFRVAPLSFVGGNRWVKWVADGNSETGRNHVNFALDAQGEALLLYSTTFNLLHAVYFGAQRAGVSEGLVPDGGTNIVGFVGSDSPGEGNYLVPDNVLISEVLTHTDPPLEDAVELYNPTTQPALIGGWYLSDSQENFRKCRLPDGTTVPAGQYLVLYEYQFNSGATNSFALDSARGGEIWLSAADAGGNLTGYRAVARFGAATNGMAIGRHVMRTGVDFVPLSQRTFGVDHPGSLSEFRAGTGLPNAYPLVGPVVVSEIMYHPPSLTGEGDNTADEYLELYNLTDSTVPLFDAAHPTNTWQLGGGVNYAFPQNTVLEAGSYLLVVSFNPTTDPSALAAFRARHGLPLSVPIYGPYAGKLDNGGESVELYRPDTPQPTGSPEAGFVPLVLVDRVDYTDAPPWPSGAVDGGGLSLQRREAAQYGNDPLNWIASAPTPGASNGAGVVPPPVITQSPQSQTVIAYHPFSLGVAASGTGPLSYQWRLNGANLPGETNTTLIFDDLQAEHAGRYDVFVSSAGGTTLSDAAQLQVHAPPVITYPPLSQTVPGGTNVTFTATAIGTAPLSYQWRFNGVDIPGATNSVLSLSNVNLRHVGTYTVEASNFLATTSANATLEVRVRPGITQQPTPAVQNVAAGSTVSMAISATGTLPMHFRWRRGGSTYAMIAKNTFTEDVITTCVLTITNVQSDLHGGSWTVAITNQAGLATNGLSTPAILNVYPPTVFANQPQSQTVAAGADVAFSAGVTGYGVLSYQWYHNGTWLADQTNTTLHLFNVTTNQEGVYILAVSNLLGIVTSSNAVLILDSDADGLPDTWEFTHGLNATNAADAALDSDGDTQLNWQEYVAGTDPQDGGSYLKVDQITSSGPVSIQFAAVSNRTYTVQYADVVADGPWRKLADVDARATNRIETVTDPSPGACRYYRLVVPKQE